MSIADRSIFDRVAHSPPGRTTLLEPLITFHQEAACGSTRQQTWHRASLAGVVTHERLLGHGR